MLNTELIDLRAVTEEDCVFCYEVKKAALRVYVEPIWGWDEQEQIDFHRRDWDSKLPEIITLEGKGIGTIEVIRTDDSLLLGEFYLFPEVQKQGIGSYLLSRLVQEADEKNLPVKLQVIKSNPAKRLYLRFEFEITGETKTHFLMQKEPNKII